MTEPRIIKDINDLQLDTVIHTSTTVLGFTNIIKITTKRGDYEYRPMRLLRFKVTVSNTSPSPRVSVDGKVNVTLLKADGTNIPAGFLKVGKVYDCYYDEVSGGRFFLIN